MDLENNSQQGEGAPTSGIATPESVRREENNNRGGIVTPNDVRKESYPDNQDIVVNSSGDIKDTNTGEVTTPTGETYMPTTNQNDLDINKYREVEHKVETDSVVTPSGKRIYRRRTGEDNTGAGYDLESGQHMETRHSKEAPETDSFVSAKEVEEKLVASRDQSHQDLMSGGANWRNSKGQFSKEGEGRLDLTDKQVEEARSEMIADKTKTTDSTRPNREAKEEEIEENRGLNKDMTSTGMSGGMKQFFQEQDDIVKRAKEQDNDTNKELSDEERYKKFQDIGINTRPGISITDESTWAQDYKKSLEGDHEEGTPIPVTPENKRLNEMDERINNIDAKLEDIQEKLSILLADQEPSPTPEQNPQPEEQPVEQTPVTPEPNNMNDTLSRLQTLEDENRDLRGENTWEQRSADYARQMAELREIENTRPLTEEERIRYYNLDREKRYIDQNMIAPEQQESKRRRENKEKVIKVLAGIAGAGVALATPAVGVAAVVAVTVGGRFAGKGLKSWSEKIRAKSNAMKYEDRTGKTREELEEFDKKQRRKTWWADRLGEAAAVVTGGTIGYGIGAAIQNITGWRIGGGNAAETAGASSSTPEAVNPEPQPTSEGMGNSDIISGQGDIPTPEITQGLNPDALPSRISLSEYPDLAKGLVERGMDPSKVNGDLFIQGTEGGWAARQGDALREILNRGLNPNSKVAGWAIGEHAANGTPIETALDMAQNMFTGN